MKYQELLRLAKAKNEQALTILSGDNPDMEQVKALRNDAASLTERANQVKAIEADIADAQAPQMPVDLPSDEPTKATKPANDGVAKAAYVLQYGDIDESTDRIMNEVYGSTNYHQTTHDQVKSFSKFMRTGIVDRNVDKRQLWPANAVKNMIRQGMSIDEIKATQMEASDVLGGYAVPAMITDRIVQRQAGLSSVRSAGATVVNLTANSVEMLSLTGGDAQYSSALRGVWGNETSTPTAKNITFGTETIQAHVYTYKTPFTVSLLEDAPNVVDIFTGKVAETLAIDEDNAFLTGNGVNKPQGILPGGLNTLSLTEQVSLSAAALTIGGLKLLRRAVASQYRTNATLLGNSDTGGDIEALVDSDGSFYFDMLTPGMAMPKYGATWRESEALPDVGAGNYALVFGDFSGYYIVERLGMSIQRFQDAYTGANIVEFHIRRRVGGRVVEPWKFGVQKVAAS